MPPLFNLPYRADPAILPAALPAVEEIHSARDVLCEAHRKRVVSVGQDFVVKYGFGIFPLEGEIMLFLRQFTSVPVPVVYAIFQIPHPEHNHICATYIVMERIQGETLESQWPKMSHAAKETVSLKLRSIFEEMRNLESPGGYCTLGSRGLPDDFFWKKELPNDLAGPFDTETGLNEAMVANCFLNGRRRYAANFYSRAFERILQGHPPTFSHGDIQKKNIMIRSSGNVDGHEEQPSESEMEIVIIDWETGGWYPSYWEYVRALYGCARWDDDWNVWIETFLEPKLNEYAWTMMFMQEFNSF